MEAKLIEKTYYYLWIVLLGFIAFSCEEEFVPEINNAPPEIVVEGYIEAGDNATSPYVILTRSIPFFNEINLNNANDFYVRGADITVTNRDVVIELQEFCLNDLDPAQQVIAAEFFGIDLDSAMIDFCVYIDPTFSMVGVEGEQYDLNIEVEGKTITATTTLPEVPTIVEYAFSDTPGVPNDTLRELRMTLQDDPNEANFYRYFTNVNDAGELAPITSVLNDLFFAGEVVEFPLPKAEPRGVEFNLETFGYYELGDTVEIKFCTIDEAHYDFWSTLEFNRANQGPFSSYTAISYNIEGGIGIWGGYSAYITRLIVE
jgi:hypothetical protein